MNADNQSVEIDAPLRALIAEHAPHGFAGFMRGPGDGCPVYVAAVALSDALRHPPEGGAS